MSLAIYVNQAEPPLPGSIEHTTYLFTEFAQDGYVRSSEPEITYDWDDSSPAAIGFLSKSSDGAGWDSGSTNTAVVPAAPSPANATGNYRTRIYTMSFASGNQGIQPDVAIAYVRLYATDDAFMGTNTQYVYESVAYDNMIMWGREVAPDDFSEGEGVDRYYEGDWEGEEIYFYVSAYADIGTDRYASALFNTGSIYNEAEYTDGNLGFEGARDAETGDYSARTGATSDEAMYVEYDVSDPTKWFRIKRSFFAFDSSAIDSATRQITSASLNITGIDNSDSSVIAFIGTQSDTIQNSDYDAFGAVVSDVVAWQHTPFPAINVMSMNSTGLTHVAEKVEANATVKFCLREYEHDYLNVAPDIDNKTFSNGCAYSASSGHPYLKIVYNKVPEYYDATIRFHWTIVAGSWNGSGWDSAGASLDMIALGTWEDDERWAAIKITFTGVSTLSMDIENNDNVKLINGETITSGQIVTLPWRGHWDDSGDDFDEIILTSSGASYTLTKIEFLEA